MPGRKASDVPSNVRDKALYRRKRAAVKRSVRVWPSAYASGQLVQAYKRAGGRYYNPGEGTKVDQVLEFEKGLIENPSGGLDKWFAEKWVDLGRSIDAKGRVKKSGWVQCGRPDSGEGSYPKCVPLAKAKSMSPSQRLSAVRRKRAAEKGAEKSRGRKPIMVKTFKNPGDEPIFFVAIETPRFTMIDSSHERAGPAYERALHLESIGADPVAVVSGKALESMHRQAKREGRIVRHAKAPKRLPNPRNSLVKDALRAEAIKYRKFEEFADDYWNDCARGIYWTPSDDAKFRVGPVEKSRVKERRFFLYCNPEQAIEASGAKYVAEIDTTSMPNRAISHSRTPKGVTIRIVSSPGQARVLRTLQADKAKRSFKYQQGILPSSKAQLHKFWKDAWDRHNKKVEKEAARRKRLFEKDRARQEKKRQEAAEKAKKAKAARAKAKERAAKAKAAARRKEAAAKERERKAKEREGKRELKKVVSKAKKSAAKKLAKAKEASKEAAAKKKAKEREKARVKREVEKELRKKQREAKKAAKAASAKTKKTKPTSKKKSPKRKPGAKTPREKFESAKTKKYKKVKPRKVAANKNEG